MTKDFRVYLDDVIQSCTLIAEYISGGNKEQFDNDTSKQDAVIRRLEIIGEAVKRLPLEFREQHIEALLKQKEA
ncbi:MAG: HepT-like ribonuclease domain-containing protein [Candidatus Levyibacteriota bacterium]